MQIENSQCTLAQAQIGRYVAGETLPEDVLASLEAHLEECVDCRALVREQRSALEVRTGVTAPEPIDPPNLAETFPDPEPMTPVLMEESPATDSQPTAAGSQQPASESDSAPASSKVRLPAFREALRGARNGKRKFGHPLVWSGALAIVLIAMSYVAKNPSLIFGKKASETKSAEQTKEKSKDPTNGTSQEEPAARHKSDDKAKAVSDGPEKEASHEANASHSDDKPVPVPSKDPPVEPKVASHGDNNLMEAAKPVTSHSEKQNVVRKSPAIRIRKSVRPAPARPRQDTGTIKVYDAAGKPIQP